MVEVQIKPEDAKHLGQMKPYARWQGRGFGTQRFPRRVGASRKLPESLYGIAPTRKINGRQPCAESIMPHSPRAAIAVIGIYASKHHYKLKVQAGSPRQCRTRPQTPLQRSDPFQNTRSLCQKYVRPTVAIAHPNPGHYLDRLQEPVRVIAGLRRRDFWHPSSSGDEWRT